MSRRSTVPMKTLGCLVSVLAMGATACAQSLPLVPPPAEVEVDGGKAIDLPGVLAVSSPDDVAWKSHLEIVATHVQRMTKGGHRLTFGGQSDARLRVRKSQALSEEAYLLKITADQILLEASTLKGLAHGTATLMQLLGSREQGTLPALSISDDAKVPYRSLMIDMGRNPHSIDLLKETVDLCWYYKIDSVHLHLTDDQRIAFPSTAFPKLWDGLITVDDFKELEAYAVARGVTLIPELEVPGHSTLLRRHYPDVFGESGSDLARTESALAGIKMLLDEMMEVFSSTPYVHIGGDEAFGVPEELQRDLINTLNEYLKSKGRQTLVWEGPRAGTGDNKVDADVIHINWRTINYPADQMVADGHRVVNAAWDPLYLVDHYPRINFTMTSPRHVYETLSLSRFKHVNPGIPTYAKPVQVESSDQLIGFCMPWWEGREENFFRQSVPRIIPFAEVAWDPSLERDFEEFSVRSALTEAVRQSAFYPVSIEASDLVVPADGVFHHRTDVSFKSRVKDEVAIRYTSDGSSPTAASPRYSGPIALSKNTTVRAAAFKEGVQVGHGSRARFTMVAPKENLALKKPVTSSVPSGRPFSVERVTDGGTDNLDFYLAYPADPVPVEVTIDLERVQPVSRVTVTAYTVSNSYEKYTVEVSVDGTEFKQVAERLGRPKEPQPTVTHEFPERRIRFVRIRSHGNKGYVFDSFSKLVEVQVH